MVCGTYHLECRRLCVFPVLLFPCLVVVSVLSIQLEFSVIVFTILILSALSVCLSLCLALCLSLFLSLFPSLLLSFHLSFSLSIYLSSSSFSSFISFCHLYLVLVLLLDPLVLFLFLHTQSLSVSTSPNDLSVLRSHRIFQNVIVCFLSHSASLDIPSPLCLSPCLCFISYKQPRGIGKPTTLRQKARQGTDRTVSEPLFDVELVECQCYVESTCCCGSLMSG